MIGIIIACSLSCTWHTMLKCNVALCHYKYIYRHKQSYAVEVVVTINVKICEYVTSGYAHFR